MLRVKCLAEEHNTMTLPGLSNLKFQNVMCIQLWPQVPTFLTVVKVNIKQTLTKNNKINFCQMFSFPSKAMQRAREEGLLNHLKKGKRSKVNTGRENCISIVEVTNLIPINFNVIFSFYII